MSLLKVILNCFRKLICNCVFELAGDGDAVLVVHKNIQKCCGLEHVTDVLRLRSTLGNFYTAVLRAHLQFCLQLVGVGDDLLVSVNTSKWVVI